MHPKLPPRPASPPGAKQVLADAPGELFPGQNVFREVDRTVARGDDAALGELASRILQLQQKIDIELDPDADLTKELRDLLGAIQSTLANPGSWR